MSFEDLAERIPATISKRGRGGPDRSTQDPRVRHYCLTPREFARWNNVDVAPCDWLRIESTFPMVVIVDGRRVLSDEDVAPTIKTAATGPKTFAPSFADTSVGFQSVRLRPTLAFTIQRPVRTLTLQPTDNQAGINIDSIPGTIHLWIGNGDVVDVGFGLPISHCVRVLKNVDPVDTETFVTGIRPTLHGNNATAPSDALRYVPTRTVFTGFWMSVVWAGIGANSAILEVTLQQAMQFGLGAFCLTTFCPGRVNDNSSSIYQAVFEAPIEINPYVTRQFRAGDNGGEIQASVIANQDMDNLTMVFRCLSWM